MDDFLFRKSWMILALAFLLSSADALAQSQSNSTVVIDPFPSLDCTAYDTGPSIWEKHSDACRSFLQLVKAKDQHLPLFFGPVYACFEDSDQLLVIDTALEQARSDDKNKNLAALPVPLVEFYKSGISDGGITVLIGFFLKGKWDSFGNYHGTTDSASTKGWEKESGHEIPRATFDISAVGIELLDWKIQLSTGRFTYWTKLVEKPIQLSGQCAIFKREMSGQGNVLHWSWKKLN